MLKLATIRDLLIVIAIYLYFIAWVYLHSYYRAFGISVESLRLDYSAYLVFSYNVLYTTGFLMLAIGGLIFFTVCRIIFVRKMRSPDLGRRRRVVRFFNGVIILSMIALFPLLYPIARKRAIDNYVKDRTSLGNLHRAKFTFRNDAKFIESADSASYLLRFLLKDDGQTLRLIGETDENYIVLKQPPYSTRMKSFPRAHVYYVGKKDVLMTVVLSSR